MLRTPSADFVGGRWFTTVMPEAIMTLRFEGVAVDTGTMDVRQLAPALIAAADAMREAHLLLRAHTAQARRPCIRRFPCQPRQAHTHPIGLSRRLRTALLSRRP